MILFSVITMMIVQVLYYYQSYQLTRSRSLSNFEYFADITSKNISSLLLNIERVAFSISYNRDIQRYILYNSPYDRFMNKNTVMEILDYTANENSSIAGIFIETIDKTLVKSSSVNFLQYFSAMDNFDISAMTLSDGVYSDWFLVSFKNDMYFAYIYPIYSTIRFNPDRIAFCVVLCSSSIVEDSIKDMPSHLQTQFILSSGDMIIFSNIKWQQEDQEKTLIELINVSPDGSNSATFNNRSNIFNIYRIEKVNWVISNIVSTAELTRDIMPVAVTSLAIQLITAILLFFADIAIIRNISVPIASIVKELETVGNKDIAYRLQLSVHNEIGAIVKHINEMLNRIEIKTTDELNAQSDLHRAEIVQQQMELAFYQSQINPHFLYNSLECMRSMALVDKNMPIVHIVTSITKYLRYAIRPGYIVSVKDEMETLSEYFHVLSYRFPGKLSFDISIDQAIYESKMIKMTLQPLIENSMLHGFKSREKGCHISLKGYKEMNKSILEVIDNGIGLTDEKRQELLRLLSGIGSEVAADTYKGIGMANINKRYELCFGSEYGLSIFSPEQGLGVKITIPL